MRISDYFALHASENPERLFIRTEQRNWTYADFYQEAGRFASFLQDRYGIEAHSRIVLCFPNEIEYLIAYFASMILGATAIPVDFECREQTLSRIVEDAGPGLILFSSKKVPIPSVGPAQAATFPQSQEYGHYPVAARAAIEGQSCALISYTSGTTGKPKGVMLSHDTVAYTTQRIVEWAEWQPDNFECTVLRLTHSFGLGHVHCTVMTGASLYLMESFRDPQRFLRAIEETGITGFPSTPAMIQLLLTYHREAFGKACVRLSYIVINTSPIPRNLVEDLLQLLPNTRIYMYYGLTEASRTTYIAYRRHPDKLDSVGRPPEGVQVRIDAHTREIQIKGANVMLGYLNEDRSFTEDGWFATGDTGRLDEDGFLYVTGRLKEQINMDGLKINPAEVETIIRLHPSVQDCIVFGVSDPLTFEKVAAVLICHSQPDNPRALYAEIKKQCKEQLELYKIPREFQIWNAVPRTDSGKPMRLKARELWEKGEVL